MARSGKNLLSFMPPIGELTIDHESKEAVWVSIAKGAEPTFDGFPAAITRRGTLSGMSFLR